MRKQKKALYTVSGGDCRRMENIMQSCAALGKNVTDDLVYSMAAVANPEEIDVVLKLALKNKFVEARDKLLDIMLKYGLAGLDAIKQIQKEILNLDIDNKKKMILIEKCGEMEFRVSEGSDEFVQLEALLAQIVLEGSK